MTAITLLAGCTPGWQPTIQVDPMAPQSADLCATVAVLDNGDAVIAFLGGAQVWSRRFVQAANAWEPVQQLSTMENVSCPRVVADAAGNLVIAWNASSDGTSANRGVWTRNFQAGAWSEPELVDADGQLLDLVMTRQGNAVMTVVHPVTKSTYALLRPSGGQWGAEQLVSDPDVPGDRLFDARAVELGGVVHLALTWERDVTAGLDWLTSFVDFDLATDQPSVGSAEMVFGADQVVDSPSVGMDGTGRLLFAWRDLDHNLWLRQRREAWSDPMQLADNVNESTIAVDDDGSALLAWTTADGELASIARRRLVAGAWSPVEVLGLGEHARIALSGGHALIGWTVKDSLVEADLHRIDSGGVARAALTPGDSKAELGVQAVGVGHDGTAIVAMIRTPFPTSTMPTPSELVLFAAVHPGD